MRRTSCCYSTLNRTVTDWTTQKVSRRTCTGGRSDGLPDGPRQQVDAGQSGQLAADELSLIRLRHGGARQGEQRQVGRDHPLPRACVLPAVHHVQLLPELALALLRRRAPIHKSWRHLAKNNSHWQRRHCAPACQKCCLGCVPQLGTLARSGGVRQSGLSCALHPRARHRAPRTEPACRRRRSPHGRPAPSNVR